MDEGKTYEVFYDDDSRTRHKTLVFVKETNSFLVFHNEYIQRVEIILISKITRIEGKKEYENK